MKIVLDLPDSVAQALCNGRDISEEAVTNALYTYAKELTLLYETAILEEQHALNEAVAKEQFRSDARAIKTYTESLVLG